MKRKPRTRKSNRKIKSNHVIRLLRGSATISLIIILIIIGSVLMVGGVFPGSPGSQNLQGRAPGAEVILDESALNPGNTENALQLQTLKFKECTESQAITMQLDITGSMSGAIQDLKNAVFAFTSNMSDNSVIGIQAYSTNDARLEVIPVSFYRDVKNQIQDEVGGLTAGGRTPTYDALLFSREILENAINNAIYVDRKFSFIFFSDGNPNEGPDSVADISAAAQGIKDLGVTVYSIGLGNVKDEYIDAVASSSDTSFKAPSPEQLTSIYQQIGQKICE